jgi:L1 cell adhesion molecule like protein
MNSSEDFLYLVVSSYITGAAMEVLGMKSLDDCPISLPEDFWLYDEHDRKQKMDIILAEVMRYTNLKYNDPHLPSTDKVFMYCKQLMSIGSLYLEFADAVKEGDGDRIKRCWKYLMVIHHNSNRVNFAKEAVILLHQHEHLSPKQAEQLLYNRFITQLVFQEEIYLQIYSWST